MVAQPLEHDVIAQRSSFGRIAKLSLVVICILAVGFATGISVGSAQSTRIFSGLPLIGDRLDATPDQEADLTTFWKVWNALNTRFVDSQATGTAPSVEERVWGAIEGLAASYNDPYTVFLPPSEAKQFQDDIRGDFEGVGMEIGVKDGVLTIIAPLKGTPAERAGLRSGDKILSIDGTSTDGMSSDAAVKIIRGPKGTPVVFMILREGVPQEVSVVRDTIQVPTLETEIVDGVFVLSLHSFTANSNQLVARALSEFRASGSNKLIIDLRSNPGGYLDAAVAIAGHFLPRGAAVVIEDYNGKQENIIHRSRGTGGIPEGTRIAILIDQGSASASEILAGALQDAEIATLIGMPSFGKGSVQELVEVHGGALKVTVARWLTPAGQSISEGGLKPDIEVPYTPEDREAQADPQLERAVRFLISGQ